MSLKVLALSGSLRLGSYNRKLLQIAKRFADEAVAEVKELDLKTLNLPMYDADLEAKGFPPSVQELRKTVSSADVFLIASPENNYSITAALKNAFDWGSRQGNVFAGKVAAIMSASPGKFGGVRGQLHLRQILVELDVFVLPKPQVHVGGADEAFNPDGSLKDPKSVELLQKLVNDTLAFAEKLKS